MSRSQSGKRVHRVLPETRKSKGTEVETDGWADRGDSGIEDGGNTSLRGSRTQSSKTLTCRLRNLLT